MNATPGYNSRLTIRLSSDRNGKPLAHYWSGYGTPGFTGIGTGRWIRISALDAVMFIAQDQADDFAKVGA